MVGLQLRGSGTSSSLSTPNISAMSLYINNIGHNLGVEEFAMSTILTDIAGNAIKLREHPLIIHYHSGASDRPAEPQGNLVGKVKMCMLGIKPTDNPQPSSHRLCSSETKCSQSGHYTASRYSPSTQQWVYKMRASRLRACNARIILAGSNASLTQKSINNLGGSPHKNVG